MDGLETPGEKQRNMLAKAKDQAIVDLVTTGTSIVGSCGGSILGFLLGGPLGAGLGALLGPSLVAIVGDATDWLMSNRERKRVGAAVICACEKIQEHFDAGHELRRDGFFEAGENDRSKLEEILEGALLKCRDEHEEKKLRFIAYIPANAAFAQDVSPAEANRFLQLAHSLTYCKMCILALLGRRDELADLQLRPNSWDAHMRLAPEQLPPDTISVAQEAFDLLRLDLATPSIVVGYTPETGPYTLTRNSPPPPGLSQREQRRDWFVNRWEEITPDKLILSYTGRRLFDLLGLDSLPEDDIRDVARHLCYDEDLHPTAEVAGAAP